MAIMPGAFYRAPIKPENNQAAQARMALADYGARRQAMAARKEALALEREKIRVNALQAKEAFKVRREELGGVDARFDKGLDQRKVEHTDTLDVSKTKIAMEGKHHTENLAEKAREFDEGLGLGWAGHGLRETLGMGSLTLGQDRLAQQGQQFDKTLAQQDFQFGVTALQKDEHLDKTLTHSDNQLSAKMGHESAEGEKQRDWGTAMGTMRNDTALAELDLRRDLGMAAAKARAKANAIAQQRADRENAEFEAKQKKAKALREAGERAMKDVGKGKAALHPDEAVPVREPAKVDTPSIDAWVNNTMKTAMRSIGMGSLLSDQQPVDEATEQDAAGAAPNIAPIHMNEYRGAVKVLNGKIAQAKMVLAAPDSYAQIGAAKATIALAEEQKVMSRLLAIDKTAIDRVVHRFGTEAKSAAEANTLYRDMYPKMQTDAGKKLFIEAFTRHAMGTAREAGEAERAQVAGEKAKKDLQESSSGKHLKLGIRAMSKAVVGTEPVPAGTPFHKIDVAQHGIREFMLAYNRDVGKAAATLPAGKDRRDYLDHTATEARNKIMSHARMVMGGMDQREKQLEADGLLTTPLLAALSARQGKFMLDVMSMLPAGSPQSDDLLNGSDKSHIAAVLQVPNDKEIVEWDVAAMEERVRNEVFFGRGSSEAVKASLLRNIKMLKSTYATALQQAAIGRAGGGRETFRPKDSDLEGN